MSEVAVGQRYGAWTVLSVNEENAQKVLCSCDCGRTTHEVRKYDLTHGKTLMCRRCSVAVSKTSHGASPYGKSSPEYTTWIHMIQRCHNPRSKDYKNYGGRGIEVCELWRDSFEAFFLMVGERPTDKHTIERLDTNKNYEPGNCVWATRTQQNRNTRSNVRLTIDGETKVVTEWAEHPDCSVSVFTIYKRINRGWSPRDAVFTHSKGKK